MDVFIFLQHSEEGNESVSVLSFIPVIDDDGKYLTCRAENPEINDSALEDRWRLNVHCKLQDTANAAMRKQLKCSNNIKMSYLLNVPDYRFNIVKSE